VRRLLTPLAAVALVGLGVLLAVQLTQPSASLNPADQATQLAAELRCPDCQSLSVAESRTAAADAIRREIAEQLAAGHTPDQIRQHFVARYGRWILLQPSDPLIWLLPVGALLLGVVAFVLWLRRLARSPVEAGEPPASAEDRRRVRDELEALDG
jgi:cytochrome c-type biogenesis protein CcmH